MKKIIKKIRLKKDTPDHKAGELFVLMSNNGIYEMDAGEDDPAVFYGGDIDNFDEWFEEVKEPTWVRKQIKQIEFGEHKSVYVVVRFIKNQNYICICYDNELGDAIANNEPGEIKRIYFHADDNGSWRQKDYDILNQMVRDGYIEIEDNPNIVWEDEKCD